MIIVVGEKEQNGKFLPRFRSKEVGIDGKEYLLKAICDLAINKIKGYPQEKIPLPVYLSKRPKFK